MSPPICKNYRVGSGIGYPSDTGGDIIPWLVSQPGRSRRSPAPPSGPLGGPSGPLGGPSGPLGGPLGGSLDGPSGPLDGPSESTKK